MGGSWECTRCTFLHHAPSSRCVMCGELRITREQMRDFVLGKPIIDRTTSTSNIHPNQNPYLKTTPTTAAAAATVTYPKSHLEEAGTMNHCDNDQHSSVTDLQNNNTTNTISTIPTEQNNRQQSYSPGIVPMATELAHEWIYPTDENFPKRQYQFEMAQTAIFHNTLVSLPTGLGKTLIAAVVLYNYYRWFPTGKVIFMAPTLPLVNQQVQACYDIMGIPAQDTAVLTGKLSATTRESTWNARRVFFCTPQTVQNDLEAQRLEAQHVVCVVLDEAHKATGDYAYVKVVQHLMQTPQPRLRIVGLSATPGTNLQAIQQVVDALHISKIEARTESDPSVAPYIHQREYEIVVVQQVSACKTIERALNDVLAPVLEMLRKAGALQRLVGNATLTSYHIILARQSYTQRNEATDGRLLGYFSAAQQLVQLRADLHKHGVGLVRTKLVRWRQERQRGIMSTIVQGKEFENLWNQVVNATYDNAPDTVQEKLHNNPKLSKLQEILIEHFERARACQTSSRAIVFSQFRDSVSEIVALLQASEPLIRPRHFVGQGKGAKAAAPGETVKGMKQAEQHQVIREFRQDVYNVLVCTCIGEEGLDIGEVDLIVNFDTLRSPIRMIQRTGRTGRKRNGRVVCLVAEGPEEKTLMASKQSERNLVHALKNPRSFKVTPSIPLFPTQPRVTEKSIEFPQRFHMSQVEGFDGARQKVRMAKPLGLKPSRWRLLDHQEEERVKALGTLAKIHQTLHIGSTFPDILRRRLLNGRSCTLSRTKEKGRVDHGSIVNVLRTIESSHGKDTDLSDAIFIGGSRSVKKESAWINTLFPLSKEDNLGPLLTTEIFSNPLMKDLSKNDSPLIASESSIKRGNGEEEYKAQESETSKCGTVTTNEHDSNADAQKIIPHDELFEETDKVSNSTRLLMNPYSSKSTNLSTNPYKKKAEARNGLAQLKSKNCQKENEATADNVHTDLNLTADHQRPCEVFQTTRHTIDGLSTNDTSLTSDFQTEVNGVVCKSTKSFQPILSSTAIFEKEADDSADVCTKDEQSLLPLNAARAKHVGAGDKNNDALYENDPFILPDFEDEDSTSENSRDHNQDEPFVLPDVDEDDDEENDEQRSLHGDTKNTTTTAYQSEDRPQVDKNNFADSSNGIELAPAGGHFLLPDSDDDSSRDDGDNRPIADREETDPHRDIEEGTIDNARHPDFSAGRRAKSKYKLSHSSSCTLHPQEGRCEDYGACAANASITNPQQTSESDDPFRLPSEDEALSSSDDEGMLNDLSKKSPTSFPSSSNHYDDSPLAITRKKLVTRKRAIVDTPDTDLSGYTQFKTSNVGPSRQRAIMDTPDKPLSESRNQNRPLRSSLRTGLCNTQDLGLHDTQPSQRRRSSVTFLDVQDNANDDNEPADDIVCAICQSGNSPEYDPILLCDGPGYGIQCNLAVHMTCYSIPHSVLNSDDDWRCDVCEFSSRGNQVDRIVCSLCAEPHTTHHPLQRRADDSEWRHVTCAPQRENRARRIAQVSRKRFKYHRFIDEEAAIDSDSDVEGDNDERDLLADIEEEEAFQSAFINDSSQLGYTQDELDRVDSTMMHRALDNEREHNMVFATPLLNARLRRQHEGNYSDTPSSDQQGLGNMHFVRSVLEHCRQGGDVQDIEDMFQQIEDEAEGNDNVAMEHQQPRRVVQEYIPSDDDE